MSRRLHFSRQEIITVVVSCFRHVIGVIVFIFPPFFVINSQKNEFVWEFHHSAVNYHDNITINTKGMCAIIMRLALEFIMPESLTNVTLLQNTYARLIIYLVTSFLVFSSFYLHDFLYPKFLFCLSCPAQSKSKQTFT